jgi:hypothetical protein
LVVGMTIEMLKDATSSATMRIFDMTSPSMDRRVPGKAAESSAASQASLGAVHLWLNRSDGLRRRM